MELCKLAVWHSMQYADVDTNLIGIQSTKQLQMNLNVLRNGITEKEKVLLEEIQEKYVLLRFLLFHTHTYAMSFKFFKKMLN